METFDIFVKGIDSDRLEESEQIKKQLSGAFHISMADVDELLALPNGACIRRGVSETEAIEYQRALAKLGLVSLYLPSKRKVTLELEPIEEELAATAVLCPNCDNNMFVEEDSIAPEKCDSCGVDIAKFLAQKEAEAERAAIKAKLLASQSIQKTLEEKRQQEEAQRQRKVELEKQVLEEIGIKIDEKKLINRKLLLVGIGSISLAVGAGYFFSLSTPNAPALNTTTSVVTEESNQINPSSQQSTPSTNTPLDAQQSMQKTHDQAAQVLNGFGLDPDAFADAGASSPASTLSTNSEINAAVNPQSVMTAQNKTSSANITAVAFATNQSVESVVKMENTQPLPIQNTTTQQKTIIQQSNLINTELLQASIENDVTWDKFLAQNSKMLFDRKLPEKALQLAQFIVANDVYIEVIGEQIAVAQKEKQPIENYLAVLETRLMSLPPDEQAIYFAQASTHLSIENGTNRLLIKAENLLANLPTSELQLKVILKIAVAYSKLGNIASANDYFSKINSLISAVTDVNSQSQLRTAVATSYCEISNTSVASQWFSSIEPLISQVTPRTRSEVANAYARCNQWQSISSLFSQASENETALYQALTVLLKAGFVTSAIELHKNFHSPIYQALGGILIADYSPAIAESLLETVLQTTKKLSLFEQVFVFAQLIDYLGRLKDKTQLEKLLVQNKELLANLPTSDEKDALLRVITLHYSHGLQNEQASFLLTSIQNSHLKTSLNVEISQLAKVRELLK